MENAVLNGTVIEEKKSIILYHATFKDNVPSIQKNSLMRDCPKNFEGMYNIEAVYLAFDPEAAVSYMESADTYDGQEIAVFEVSLDADDGNVGYDINNRCESESDINSVAYYGDIPGNRLRLMSRDEADKVPERKLIDFQATLLYEVIRRAFYGVKI